MWQDRIFAKELQSQECSALVSSRLDPFLLVHTLREAFISLAAIETETRSGLIERPERLAFRQFFGNLLG